MALRPEDRISLIPDSSPSVPTTSHKTHSYDAWTKVLEWDIREQDGGPEITVIINIHASPPAHK